MTFPKKSFLDAHMLRGHTAGKPNQPDSDKPNQNKSQTTKVRADYDSDGDYEPPGSKRLKTEMKQETDEVDGVDGEDLIARQQRKADRQSDKKLRKKVSPKDHYTITISDEDNDDETYDDDVLNSSLNDDDISGKMLFCAKCEVSFPTKISFEEHNNEHHPEEQIQNEQIQNIEVPAELIQSNHNPVELLQNNLVPVQLLQSNQGPVELLQSNQGPVELLQSNQVPIELLQSNQVPVLIDNNQVPAVQYVQVEMDEAAALQDNVPDHYSNYVRFYPPAYRRRNAVNEQMFDCPLCSRTYCHSRSLYKHMRDHHSS